MESNTKTAAAGGQTRLFTADPAINGAVVGLGVGVVGSLLLGALLEDKNNCNNRGRRDTTGSTRSGPGSPSVSCNQIGTGILFMGIHDL